MKRNDLVKTLIIMLSTVIATVGLALLLNLVTGQKIAEDAAKREELAAQQAAGVLVKVLPGATGFEEITSTLTIDPTSGVTAVHKETSGKGYVFVSRSTYGNMKDDVVVTLGVDMEGKITGIDISFVNSKDFPVSEGTLNSFVGQDSTLNGVEITADATHSSNAIKAAVTSGFTVLAANDLMKAATKTTEQVFEELLSTVVNNFVKASDLEVSGNIYAAYVGKNNAQVVCYVNKGETKLLSVANVSGAVKVYGAKLIDEATQVYELEEVTSSNADVVEEVSQFASTKISSTFVKLSEKITRVYGESATEITEIAISNISCAVSAASFVVDGATYYAYNLKPVNRFTGNPVMEIHVILDSEGKICKVDILELYFNAAYWQGKPDLEENVYKDGFIGLDTESYDGSQSLIAGATLSPNAVNEAIEAAFAEFATLGGNN